MHPRIERALRQVGYRPKLAPIPVTAAEMAKVVALQTAVHAAGWTAEEFTDALVRAFGRPNTTARLDKADGR